MLKKIKMELDKIIFEIKYFLIFKNKIKKINIVDIKQPLILISQIQRSGGSLITQLFDNHPETYNYPHELFIFKPVWKWKGKANFFVYKMPEMRIYAKKKRYYKNAKAKWSENYEFNFDLNMQKYLFERKYTNKGRESFDNYFTSFFNSYEFKLNKFKKYIIAFTPRVNMEMESVDEFFKIYPDGYMINCIRNPLNWLASATKTMKKYSEPNFALRMWLESTKNSLKIKKKYKRSILVNFEELIINTENVMSKITQIINIQYSEDLLNPSFNGKDILSNSSFEAKFKIDKNVISRNKYIDTSIIEKDLLNECLEFFEISKKNSI